MKIYLISDTHFNHEKIATYCDRPADFTERIIRNWQQTVKSEDVVIHLGDVFIGKPAGWDTIHPQLTGTKILVRGNHDKQSCSWYMQHGFQGAMDSMVFRRTWLTHKPADSLPPGCTLNIFGHLHNIWHGFHGNASAESPENWISTRRRLNHKWQRLFAIEYTDYRPVEFDKFVSHPDKYQARGPNAA